MKKGRILKEHLDRLERHELERQAAYVDVLLGQMKESMARGMRNLRESYEAAYREDEEVVYAKATPAAAAAPSIYDVIVPSDEVIMWNRKAADKGKEEDEDEQSSASASSSSSDDDDDDFIEDDMNSNEMVAVAAATPKVYPKEEVAKWTIKAPLHAKRRHKVPLRYEPEVPDRAAAKRERAEEEAAETLTKSNARVSTRDKREFAALRARMGLAHWTTTTETRWGRTRYGNTLEQIRSALGREGPSQSAAQDLFDRIARDTLAGAPPNFAPRLSGTSISCSLCNMAKNCMTRMECTAVDNDHDAQLFFVLGSTCASLAQALVYFWTTLADASSTVDQVDAAFMRVCEAHANKSGTKRPRR